MKERKFLTIALPPLMHAEIANLARTDSITISEAARRTMQMGLRVDSAMRADIAANPQNYMEDQHDSNSHA